MGFLNGFKNFFSPTSQSFDLSFIVLNIKCKKCGEEIAVKLRKTSDISRIYEGEDNPFGATFFVRKEILGNKCNNLIYFTGYFPRLGFWGVGGLFFDF